MYMRLYHTTMVQNKIARLGVIICVDCTVMLNKGGTLVFLLNSKFITVVILRYSTGAYLSLSLSSLTLSTSEQKVSIIN